MDQTNETCKTTALVDALKRMIRVEESYSNDKAYEDWDRGWITAHRDVADRLKEILDKYKDKVV